MHHTDNLAHVLASPVSLLNKCCFCFLNSSPVCIKSLQSVDAGLAKKGEEEVKLRFLVQALKQLHD